MLVNSLKTLGIRLPTSARFLSSATEASSKQELFERELYLENRVARLVLNAPKIRNSLSFALMESLLNELKEMDKIQKLRAIIIAGKGPAFSAGHDLKELVSRSYINFYFNESIELLQASLFNFFRQRQQELITIRNYFQNVVS